MISIGTLEKSVTALAKKLEKAGHSPEVSTHRSGPAHNCHHQAISFVKLRINGRVIRFLANGYGDIYKSDIDGAMTWGEMKQEALKRLDLTAA
jgi:hypothetical protein